MDTEVKLPIKSEIYTIQGNSQINYWHFWVIFHFFLPSDDFFKSPFLKISFRNTNTECQMVWILISKTFYLNYTLISIF